MPQLKIEGEFLNTCNGDINDEYLQKHILECIVEHVISESGSLFPPGVEGRDDWISTVYFIENVVMLCCNR